MCTSQPSCKFEVREVQASIPHISIILHQVMILEHHSTLCSSFKRKEKEKGGGGFSAPTAGKSGLAAFLCISALFSKNK